MLLSAVRTLTVPRWDSVRRILSGGARGEPNGARGNRDWLVEQSSRPAVGRCGSPLRHRRRGCRRYASRGLGRDLYRQPDAQCPARAVEGCGRDGRPGKCTGAAADRSDRRRQPRPHPLGRARHQPLQGADPVGRARRQSAAVRRRPRFAMRRTPPRRGSKPGARRCRRSRAMSSPKRWKSTWTCCATSPCSTSTGTRSAC